MGWDQGPCRDCGTIFVRSPQMQKRGWRCPDCLRIYNAARTRLYRAANLERVKRNKILSNRKNRANVNARNRKLYRRNRPHAQRTLRARKAVFKAVRDGVLVRPEKCSECNAGGRIVGHHDDYDKPLDVRWLCYPCHSTVHTALKAARGEE